MAKLAVFVAVLLTMLTIVKQAFAATISISDFPTEITAEPFSLTVQISGAQADTTNYLRIDLYQNGTTSYFGYTYNGSDFYSGSDYTQYPQATIAADGTATKTIEGKVDIASASYNGSGSYMIRVRRYTASGGYSAQDANAGAVSTTINIVAPSPSPSPSPSPAPSPTPTPLKSPTPLPSPLKLPSPSPSPKLILGESTRSAVAQSKIDPPSPSPLPKNESSNTKTALVLTGAGLILIGLSSAFYVWYSKLLGKEQVDKKEQSEDD